MGKSGWLGVPVRGRQPVVGLEDAPPRWPRDAESLGKWKCEPRKGHEWLRPVGRKPSPPCPLPIAKLAIPSGQAHLALKFLKYS